MQYKIVKKRKLFGLKYYYQDENGKLYGKGYDDAEHFYGNYAIVKKGGKYYFIDKEKFKLHGKGYDKVESFYGNYALVKKGGKYYFIDKEKFKLHGKGYDKAESFYGNYALVKKDGKYYFVDKEKFELHGEGYDEAEDFENGLAIVKKDDKYYFVDKNLNFSDSFDYYKEYKCEDPNPNYSGYVYFKWYDGIARVVKDGKIFLVDNKGKFHGEGYDKVEVGYDYLLVKKDNKYYFLNQENFEIISEKYDAVKGIGERYSYPYALVKKDGKWYFADKEKFELHGDGYESIERIGIIHTLVKKDGKYYFIDNKNFELYGEGLDKVGNYHEGYAPVLKNGKCYFIDDKNYELHGDGYNTVRRFRDGTALVTKNGVEFSIDTNFTIPTMEECLQVAEKDISLIECFPLKFFIDQDFNYKLSKIVIKFFNNEIKKVANKEGIEKINDSMEATKNLIELKKQQAQKKYPTKSMENESGDQAKIDLAKKCNKMFSYNQDQNW